MSNNNFINFHIITSHSASNLNRDDMGLQKTALFGGKKRTRISSQCEKRALRTSNYYKCNLGEPSTRTRELGLLLTKSIEKWGKIYSNETINDVISFLCSIEDIEENTQSGAVAAWAISEIGEYCKTYLSLKENEDLIKKAKKEGEKEKNKTVSSAQKKAKKEKKKLDDKSLNETSEKAVNKGYKSIFEKELKDSIISFNENFEDGIDIALSGRMTTSGIMSNVDAALAIAQVITTHTTQSEIDWFTAVDDLSECGGSAHLDSQEFGSGVFYKYASLNIGLLQKNIGDCSREKALEIATHVLHLLATVSPSAKQNSYAAFNFADFAFVTLGDQPISLANAFETPVKSSTKGGFLKPSIEAFISYQNKLFTKYGINDACASFTTVDGLDLINEKSSFDNLKDWLKKGGIDG